MTSLVERGQIITLVQEAINSGARQDRACAVISLSERTLQRWQIDQALGDQRPCRVQTPSNRLSVLERQKVLTVVNSVKLGSLPPSQIVVNISLPNQRSIVFFGLRICSGIGVLNDRRNAVTNRVHFVRPRQISYSVGTSPICRRL